MSRTNFGIKISSKNFFWAKTSVAVFLSFKNCAKQYEESHQSERNWRKNHVGIQLQESNYKKFKSDTCNWTPTWSRADYVTNRLPGNQSRSRILFLDTINTEIAPYKKGLSFPDTKGRLDGDATRVSLPNDDVTKHFDILASVAKHYGTILIPPLHQVTKVGAKGKLVTYHERKSK